MNRKTVLIAAITVALTLTLLSCATTDRAGGDGLSLLDAIEQSAERLAYGLPVGTRVAVMGFESETENLSDFIMEEFAVALHDRGIEVADRRNLDLVMRELDFQMSGLVSDETFQGIGGFLGAEFVVTGQLWNIGQVRRLATSAIRVETAIRTSAPNLSVRNDRAMQEMVVALGIQPVMPRHGVTEDTVPETAGVYLDRGMLFLDRGDIEIAMMDFSEAIRLNPNLAAAYFWRGFAALAVDLNQAHADLTQAIRLNPNDAWAYNLRGSLHYRVGNFDNAFADFSQTIRLNPDSPITLSSAYVARGRVHFRRGNLDDAVADLTQAIRVRPNDEHAIEFRGILHFHIGDFDRAIADHTQTIRLNPDHGAAYFNRAFVHFHVGDIDRAITDYTQAIRLNHNTAQAYVNRGDAHVVRATARLIRGEMHLVRADLNQAISDFEAALRINPQHLHARNYLELAFQNREMLFGE